MLAKSGEPAEIDLQQMPRLNWDKMREHEEKSLALQCADYGRVIKKAAAELDTSVLANYLLELAKGFSRFYRQCPVLKAETEELRMARLALSCRVRDIMADGLRTLGIEFLESM